MRIAYLCCDVGIPLDGRTGSSVHVRETVRALRELGHEVLVVSPRARAEEGVEPVPLEGAAASAVLLLEREEALPPRLARDVGRLLYSEYVHRVALPALSELAPHVVYERYSLLGYAGVELARDLGVPFVLELNAPLALEQAAHRGLCLRRTATALEASILQRADALVTVSKELRTHARRLGVAGSRITVLPNAVDPARFDPWTGSGDAIRARFGLDGLPVVGFVGSLKPWHDLDTLLAACTLLRERRHDVRLLVVGDGPRADELAAHEGWIVHAGAVGHAEVPAFLAAMDVVVVPYARAAMYFSPLKLFEAMAMARPIVAARAGQPATVVAHGVTGLLYEPGDAIGLATEIELLLAAPQRAAALGAAARRLVLAEHTWSHKARRLATLLGRLARREVVAA